MSDPHGAAILAHLYEVEALRQRQARDSVLSTRVQNVKTFQHARFAQTYDDLLNQRRFKMASRFFLDELYGPHDFSERDAQFARIVPALVRLFPAEIVQTVEMLAQLHALSERLDVQMAQELPLGEMDLSQYQTAWQRVGEREGRHQQIDLMLAIGRSLQKYTKNPVLRTSLKLMRGPAKAAGLAALQRFLETGFDTFRDLDDQAAEFLEIVANRERAIVAWLFTKAEADSAPWRSQWR